MKHTAAIIGAQGYSGQELARLLLRHPALQLTQIYSRDPQWHISHDLQEPQAHAIKHRSTHELGQTAPDVDIVFLATPHEVSLELIPLLQNKVKWIIDLSGAFRLPPALFEKWYQQPHSATEILKQVQYGLCPWQTQAPTAIIANPGCYATAALMALLPLAAEDLIEDNPIIIDAKSGITGAGRLAKTELLFSEIANNFFSYKIGKHQHTPEIQNTIKNLTQKDLNIILTTQVLSVPRGIYATIYIPFKNVNEDVIQKVKASYQNAYQQDPLARCAYLPELSAKAQQSFLSLRNVVGTARTHIAYQFVDNHLVIFSMIDNLLKGAASQAIENANRILKLPLTTGLE
jgi:N-acetyl-gamma-glutamyl-phosphate reductase